MIIQNGGSPLSRKAVHLFQINQHKLALDVESDSLHLLDDLSWEVISLLNEERTEQEILSLLHKRYPEEEIREVFYEIRSLIARGQLWSEPPEIETIPDNQVVKALCLNAAHSCNLVCRYCFAGKGNYGGNHNLMPPEVGKAALDFLLQNCGNRLQAEIDYFGGEPLLNKKAIQEITSYGRRQEKEMEMHFRFTLTTNGLLLDDHTIEYLSAENFSVILSMDGRQEVHDNMRTFPDGSPSYRPVAEKLQNFLQQWSGNYYVRGTFTSFNRDFFYDVLHLYQQGFRHISLEPAIAEPGKEWSLGEKDLDYIFSQYQTLAEFYLECYRKGDPFTFFHFEIDLDKGPCLFKRLSGCGAGKEYLAVTPEGAIYPCHQLVGQDQYFMGYVQHPQEVKYPLPAKVFPPTGPQVGPCTDCWARYHCGGGCRAASITVNGDPAIPNHLECALQRKRLECALYIQARMKEEFPHGYVQR